MTEATENLVLELLRPMRGEIADFRGEMRMALGGVELRLRSVEQQVVGMHRDVLGLQEDFARHRAVADRQHDRPLRIERRLGLVDPVAPSN